MAVEVSPELAAAIDDAVARRRDLTEVERGQLREVLAVPCSGPEDRPRGCAAVPGVECVNLHDGQPLGRLLWHDVRRRRAGVELPPTSEWELKGNPKKISETGRGERMRRESGKAFPGWEEHNRRWADR